MNHVISSFQALLVAFIALLLTFSLAGIVESTPFIKDNLGDYSAFILQTIIITVGCYFTCRNNPKGIWYVPIVANIFVITSAILEPNFWTSPLAIFAGSSFILSIPASVLGAINGKKTLKT